MTQRALFALGLALQLSAQFYMEPYRPQYHFSPKTNWTNDPCGLVFFNGEYHLFFQFNPEGDRWGHMSWGHAVSRDLVHWQELPVAVPEGEDAMIFTGSSVGDMRNTSGLCKDNKPCIVSIYTGHTPKRDDKPQRQTQHLAASSDGRTWTKYPGNPVLDIGLTDFRDPKVFWHELSKQWIMIVVVPKEKKASLYGSPDLKSWKKLSDFGPAGATGGIWECPELFELVVDGNPRNTRWVLKIGLNPGHIAGGSGEQYFIGKFDGTTLHNDAPAAETRWLDYGRDCYCALTWNGERDPLSRHMIAWMNNWQYAAQAPTQPWRGAMTVARKLELRSSPQGIQLVQLPVDGLRSLRTGELSYRGVSTADLNKKIAGRSERTQAYDVEATIRPGTAKQVRLNLFEGSGGEALVIGYEPSERRIFVDRTRGSVSVNERFPSRTVAPLPSGRDELRLRVLVDHSSVEVFADDGRVVLTNLVFANAGNTGISVAADGGALAGIDLHMWNLRSVWTGSQK